VPSLFLTEAWTIKIPVEQFVDDFVLIFCYPCRDFVGSWIRIGLPAKKKTLSLMSGKPFHEQCTFCEQVSIFM
jgi:hypothetical protein